MTEAQPLSEEELAELADYLKRDGSEIISRLLATIAARDKVIAELRQKGSCPCGDADIYTIATERDAPRKEAAELRATVQACVAEAIRESKP